MVRTLLVLPDGRELFSGPDSTTAILHTTLEQRVNDETELSPGSVCAGKLSVKLIAPEGLTLAAGDTVTAYRVDPEGDRQLLGLFLLEKPVRTGPWAVELVGYDRVSLLEKDLTLWLEGLTDWPYALSDFAAMVCRACGVTLEEGALPNGDYLVKRFSADGITGRQLMQWVGQIAGRFCRATPAGTLEFAWYAPAGTVGPAGISAFSHDGAVTVTATGTQDGAGGVVLTTRGCTVTDDGAGNVSLDARFYYQGSLSYQDYAVAPIDQVRLRQNEEDVGTVYPDTPAASNAYCITGNYLLSPESPEALVPVAQTLYMQLKDVTYTPCKLSVSATTGLEAGQILTVYDGSGRQFSAYVMACTRSGQRLTLECTGAPRRDSATAVNHRSYQAFYGKVLNLRTDVDGLKAENKDTAGKMASMSLDISGITTQVSKQALELEGMQTDLTQLRQDAHSVALEIQSIRQTGVEQVTTATGYTFDAEGLRICRSGQQMENRLDNTGMYVERAGQTILQANDGGVIATDVQVRNYLMVGSHARLEDYQDGADLRRTACFFTGGESW